MTSMMAITTSCMDSTTLEKKADGVHWACMSERSCAAKLVKFYAGQFAPAAQAKRLRDAKHHKGMARCCVAPEVLMN